MTLACGHQLERGRKFRRDIKRCLRCAAQRTGAYQVREGYRRRGSASRPMAAAV